MSGLKQVTDWIPVIRESRIAMGLTTCLRTALRFGLVLESNEDPHGWDEVAS